MEQLRVVFPNIKKIPDPSSLISTYAWYTLAHVSSSMVHFDHASGRFEPLLASSWTIDGNAYRFEIHRDARFNDGTPITAIDVAASIKRQAVKKTSTHFQVWEHLVDGINISTMSSPCPGIQIEGERVITFILKHRSESFFQSMASPEGGIWSASDISDDGTLTPTRYSGPYYVAHDESHSTAEEHLVLKKNPHSILLKKYPAAPKVITIDPTPISHVASLFASQKADVFIEPELPFTSEDYNSLPTRLRYSDFNTIIYLYRIGTSVANIGQSYLEALWKQLNSPSMVPADSFLPFGSLGMLDRNSFLNALPKNSSKTINIATPDGYFRESFLELLRTTAIAQKIDLKIYSLPVGEWASLFGPQPLQNGRYDFALSPYVASERFPSIQINFLLEGRPLPFEPQHFDAPTSSEERKQELARIQTWMLSSQTILPLVFVRNRIVSASNVNLGDQPITDAELQLWRITSDQHQ